MRVKELVAFIKEREAIRVKKEAGKSRPWTKDPILAKYRFCNVHREDDRVTRWLREQYYPHFADNPDVWFAAVAARLFNNGPTLENIIGQIVPFADRGLRKTLHGRKELGFKNFNAAYIVSTNGVAMDKVDYLIDRVLTPLWAARKRMRPTKIHTLAHYHEDLMDFDGLGSFIAAQVVADLKYTEPLKSAPDWWTFAASGPGSRRGLNRIMGFATDSSWKEETWRADLSYLLEEVNKSLKWDPPLHAQDLQNCLCEADKYQRAKLGEGTPKQIYKERRS